MAKNNWVPIYWNNKNDKEKKLQTGRFTWRLAVRRIRTSDWWLVLQHRKQPINVFFICKLLVEIRKNYEDHTLFNVMKRPDKLFNFVGYFFRLVSNLQHAAQQYCAICPINFFFLWLLLFLISIFRTKEGQGKTVTNRRY